MREGGLPVSRANAKEVLKLSLYLPLENKSLENILRAKIVYSVLLHMGHPSLTYLNEHIESMDGFRSQHETIKTMDLAKQPAKRIYHLQYLSLCLTKYWRDQSMPDLDEQLSKTDALMEKIESGKNWELRMPHALEVSLWIPEMCRLLLGKGAESGSVVGTAPTMETGSLLSGITRGSGLDLSSFLQQLMASGGHLQAPQDAAGRDHRMGGISSANNNTSFNGVLFGMYKSLNVNGKSIKS